MRHRLTVLALAATTLAASATTAQAAFTTKSRPGASTFRAATAFPPRNTALPTISGTAREGQTLTATTGSWARGTTSTTITWLRCGDTSCTDIGQGATRTLTADDVGKRMRAKVTATNAGGQSTATSEPTASVAAAPPVNVTQPSITGKLMVGETVTALPGEWTRPHPNPTHRWLRCTLDDCEVLTNETGPKLLLTGAEAGKFLRYVIFHGDVAAVSANTGYVERATYEHVLCADPLTGQGVGPDGALPDGFTHTATIPAPHPGAGTRCSGIGAGIPLVTPSSYVAQNGNDRTTLHYRTPASIQFDRGEIYRHGTMSGRWSWAVQRSNDTSIFSVRFELCSWGDGCLTRGVTSPRFADANRVGIPYSNTNGFNVTIACDVPSGLQCHANGTQQVRVFGGVASLRDTANPQVTTAPTGPLATADPLPADGALHFTASDEGAGLHRVIALVDDTQVGATLLSYGRCAPTTPYRFTHQQPCPASIATNLGFDTTTWPKRGRLRILLEDAGRNTTTLVDRRIGG